MGSRGQRWQLLYMLKCSSLSIAETGFAPSARNDLLALMMAGQRSFKEEKEMKTKTELREIAKDALMSALAVAYYRIADNPDEYGLTDEEVEEVCSLMNKYGETMGKSIKKKFYTL